MRVQQFCPLGIYVVPQIDDIKSRFILIILVWHGVLIIKEGYFRQSILKFKIIFPITYPSKAPEVKFVNKVYHPLVNYSTGLLDIDVNIYFIV